MNHACISFINLKWECGHTVTTTSSLTIGAIYNVNRSAILITGEWMINNFILRSSKHKSFVRDIDMMIERGRSLNSNISTYLC
jgi:hypothetical protein